MDLALDVFDLLFFIGIFELGTCLVELLNIIDYNFWWQTFLLRSSVSFDSQGTSFLSFGFRGMTSSAAFT